eukprot:Gregarina_sp_Poly_1__5397@NODE_284_length_10057_cov_441_769369_g242_i1_p5_GENE_NODE_284_length_10057_cov_441_769369_g242_i1NODE_284_length_10057_cov_441_769369_g242_i1_p5_ORF_typecomplete_len193_score22_16Gar1/PF04410_14/3_3e29_NODE_284_length_10057_cov_441_769369_g242_i152655843
MPPGFRGRGNRGGRGGSRGGRGGFQQPVGPPNEIVEVGYSLHTCEGELVGAVTKLADQVPYFNGRVFLENKAEIGKVDEILGPLNQMFVSIKMSEGVKPESLAPNTKLYLDTQQLLPLQRFLPKPPVIKGMPKPKTQRTTRGGDGRGRGGGFPRGNSFGRGFPRGSSASRGRGSSFSRSRGSFPRGGGRGQF